MMVYRDFMRNYSNDIKLISQMIKPRFNWRTKKKQNVQCKSLLTGVWFKQAINNMYTIWQFFSNFFLQIWIFSPSSWKFLLHVLLLSLKKNSSKGFHEAKIYSLFSYPGLHRHKENVCITESWTFWIHHAVIE